ncbi:MAG: division/cell wall cluster transcriptional repressor MraZ [Deltaproteobacteria bacterium]|nr:division/cell wall cluster transcriptional repressor MraZ [Deltaproteobacteria bacterium]
MFRGRFEHQLDPKGRLALPAAFRRVLSRWEEPTLIITAHISSPCLVAYPEEEWAAFEERLSKLPQFDPSVTVLRRLYVGSAMDCPVDRQGRVLIPPVLRAHAELDREAVWVGGMRNMEIWSHGAWDAQLRTLRGGVDATLVGKLAELGL